MMKKVFALMLATLSLNAISADIQVYNWKSGNGSNVYSDTPRNMQESESNVINLRTGTVTQAIQQPSTEPLSLAEEQARLNEKIIAENKRREEENAKMIAETKAENCKTARMNLDMVNRSNAVNKDVLIPKYNSDIQKYCN